MKKDELAYIAGIFDGEGCVNFTTCRTSSYVRVLIVNTNLELLKYIKSKFGGDISRVKRKIGWKQSYQLRISYTRAINFLAAIQPWVRVKSDQILLAFCWDHYRVGRGAGRLPPWKVKQVSELNEYFKECFNYLNKRGTHSLEDPIARELRGIEWVDGEGLLSCH